MNEYTIKAANVTITSKAHNDYDALIKTGLFASAEQEMYLGAYEDKNAWVYSVEINGQKQIAVIRRV